MLLFKFAPTTIQLLGYLISLRPLKFPEIVEAFRTSGEIDYMLSGVPDMNSYDDFYKRLIERVALYDVRTILRWKN